MNLLHWLKKTPQPVMVVADDKQITVPRNARAFRDLTATIESLAPSKLTCLDKDGNVIRSVTLDEDDDDRATPGASPEMSDLQAFAKLLAEGYENGRKGSQPIVDSAMQFIDRQGQRLAKAETEIERLRAHVHKLNMHIAELTAAPLSDEPASGDDSIVASMVAGVLQAQGASAVTPIKTGAKK